MKGLLADIQAEDYASILIHLYLQPSAIYAINEAHESVLHLAAKNFTGQRGVIMIRCLIEYGASIDAVDNEGNTPLMLLAVRYAKNKFSIEKDLILEEFIDIFLEHKADINAKNDRGETPLLKACKVVFESRTFPKNNLLFHNSIRCLLHRRTNVNVSDQDGNTSLILASKYGFLGLVNSLLNRQAEIDARNKTGKTALMEVAGGDFAEKVQLLRMLLTRGSSCALADDSKNTVLHIAASKGDLSALRCIVTEGSIGKIIDDQNSKGESAVQVALKERYFEMATLLIARTRKLGKAEISVERLSHSSQKQTFLQGTTDAVIKYQPQASADPYPLLMASDDQLDPASYVLIRVWTPYANQTSDQYNNFTHQKAMVTHQATGHVSIEVAHGSRHEYISFGPQNLKKGAFSIFNYVASYFFSVIQDMDDRVPPQMSIVLFSLDTKQILSTYDSVKKQINNYSVVPKANQHNESNNCSSMAMKLLLAGDKNSIIKSSFEPYKDNILSPNIFAKVMTQVFVKERDLYPMINNKKDFDRVQREYLFSY